MALARHWLWTIPHSASLSALLSLSLKATTSYSSQSTHSFIHPIYCPSEAGSCYLKVLACIYPIHLSLPQTLSSLLLVNTQRHTVYQHERQQEAPHIFRGSQDLMWPSHWPNHQNVGSSPSLCLSPTIFPPLNKALLDLSSLKAFGSDSESEWTKQLLVWSEAYLPETKLRLILIYCTPCEISTTHGTQQWKQRKWEGTVRQLCAITINATASLSPQGRGC